MSELGESGALSDIYLWRYVASNLQPVSVCSTLENIWKYHLNKACAFSGPEKVKTLVFCYYNLASSSIEGQKL